MADIADLALKQGIGVRAAGMGGAHTAVAEDASAIYYNPAGLADVGLGYTYGSLDSQMRNNEFTFSLIKLGYLGYSEAKIVSPSGDQIGMTAFGFGNRSGWLNWGSNYKNLDWTLSGSKESGWSADLGFLMRVTPKLKFGLVAQDVLTTRERIAPASLRLGVAFAPFDGQLLLAADAELSRSGPGYGHLGIEANLIKGLSLRAGIDRGTPTAGASLDLLAFTLDYAVLLPPDGKSIQRFESGFKFNLKKERPFSFIKPKEFALIDISGGIKGGLTEYSFFGGVRPGLDTILEKIRAAVKDGGIDGIFVRLGGFSGGLGGAAVVQEIRAELLRARQKEKKIVVYIEGSALGDEYYLASVADKIVAAPGSGIGGFGRSIEIYRFPGLFKKIGIEWQVLARGKYKTSFDWLSPEMSKEQREMLEGIVSGLQRQMLTDISGSRKIGLDKLKALGDGMIYSADQAKNLGLVDRVGYFRDASFLAGEISGTKDEVKIIEPSHLEPEEAFFAQVFGVAVIEINGEIVTGSGGQNLIFGGTFTGSDKITAQIRRASEDPLIKAIILRIDSPGGAAVAAGEIYRAVQYAREKKKVVVASLGGVAASGGYYVAAAADKIVADPSTITGSIGVIGAFPAIYELLEKLDVKTDVVKEGSHADMFSGLRKLTTEETRAVENIMNESYYDFVYAVVEGRKLPTAEVERVAEGRVYTGTMALEKKLIDRLGSFSDAVDLAKAEGKILGEPRLIYYRDDNPWLQLGQSVSSRLGLSR